MNTKLLRRLRKEAFNKVSVYFVADENGGEWLVQTNFSAYINREVYYSMAEANARASVIVKGIFIEVVEHYKNLHGRGKRNFYPW